MIVDLQGRRRPSSKDRAVRDIRTESRGGLDTPIYLSETKAPDQSYMPLDTEDMGHYELSSRKSSKELEGLERWRHYGNVMIQSTAFQMVCALLIVINAVVLGFETDDPGAFRWELVEHILLILFALELLLRVMVLGIRCFFDCQSSDFTWNMFDCFIVSLGILDMISHMVQNGRYAVGFPSLFRTIRLLRILRIFRLIRFLKKLCILAYGFSLASVAVFWVAILMTAGLYFCAIILVRTLGHMPEDDDSGDAEFFHEQFGTVLKAMFSLFQLAVQPNLREYQEHFISRPLLTAFLVVFVIFGSFGMIALLTGVISEAMFEKNILRLEDERTERDLLRKKLEEACDAIFGEAVSEKSSEASREDLMLALPRIEALFEDLNVTFGHDDLVKLLNYMDTDASGTISRDEFCRGILQVTEEVRPMLVMQLHHDIMTYVKDHFSRWEAGAQQQLADVRNDAAGSREELAELRRIVLDGFRELRGGDAPLARGSEEALAPPGGRQATNKEFEKVSQNVQSLRKEVQDLQGSMFALTNRMEELVSDALSDKVQSQLAELAHRRHAEKAESHVAERVGQCEFAVQQAVGSMRGLEEVCNRMMDMSSSVATGTPALSRGLTSQSLGSQSIGMSEADHTALTTPTGEHGTLSRSGSARFGALNRSGSRNMQPPTMPVLAESGSREQFVT